MLDHRIKNSELNPFTDGHQTSFSLDAFLIIIIIIVHLWCAYYKKDIGVFSVKQLTQYLYNTILSAHEQDKTKQRRVGHVSGPPTGRVGSGRVQCHKI